MRKINTSTPDFETITNNFIYVDKTDILYDLIKEPYGYYFCSRPRRFGRTLTFSTLEAIFKGKKDLFKGLKIYDMDYDWKEYPVIHINFAKCLRTNTEELASWLNRTVMNIANEYGITLKEEDGFHINFDLLIRNLGKKEKVVVLIDEYDKILTSNLNNPQVEEMRDMIWGFLEVTKSECKYIRFVLVAGVTEFVPNSVFSSMNVLDDISMDKKYSTLFGYTQKELEYYFAEYIEKGIEKTGLSRESYLEKIRKTYGGYRFSPYQEEPVYNPVSIDSFFSNGTQHFNCFWIEDSKEMEILTDITQHVDFDISIEITEPISMDDITTFDILSIASTDIDPYSYKAMLYQNGYLTIKAIYEMNPKALILGFPNEEVAEAYTNHILKLAPSYKETEEE